VGREHKRKLPHAARSPSTLRSVLPHAKPLKTPDIYECLSCGSEWRYWAERCPSCKSTNWATQKTLQAYKEASQGRRAKASRQQLLANCADLARELLEKHKLTVPEGTTEMIAKTIAKHYNSELRSKNKGPSPRERINKAITHAAKLLQYAKRGIGDRRLQASISVRSASLRQALSDIGVVIWLASSMTIDVAYVLDRLTSGLSKEELTRLIRALRSALTRTGKSGRPPGETAYVLRAACIAWLRAGRSEKYTWDASSDILKGPLSAFVRELLVYCDLTAPSDNALQCALRVALPDCRASLGRLR
jgi:hypothetical protein